ncbi:MAG TPA: NAD-dependent epimerase/dehydratase family protein [Candidatus Gastranaerophilales bacterium]|nr:NAD-dependent epimerase/dehydratase family protein [Candidatus Gastranaerophilales bacterium]
MNIGITGGTGFLGAYLIKYLLNNTSYKIWGLTRNPVEETHENLNWIIGDLNSEYDCVTLIKNIDVLIHLAHNNSPLISNNNILSDSNLNLIPNLTLLEGIKKYGKKVHVVYISSGGTVYGHLNNYIPLKETDLCAPASSYAIQKLAVEYYLQLWSNLSHISATILRLSNPYGVLLPSSRKQGLIGVALNTLIKGEILKIYGNPQNIRDYIHLDDMCRAIEKAVNHKKKYEILNIGSGKGHSVEEITDLLEEYTNLKFKKEYINDENSRNLIDWNILDITKAGNKLGWEPEIEFNKGLQALCKEVIQSNAKNSDFIFNI